MIGALPTGRQDVRQEEHLVIGHCLRAPPIGATSAIGTRDVLSLATGIAAGKVRVAEQAGGGVAELLGGHFGVSIGTLADGIIAELALPALSAAIDV